MQRTTIYGLILGALLLTAACGDAEAVKDPAATPTLSDGKSDLAGDALNDRGWLVFGGEGFGLFDADDQLEAYRFTAVAGARITLDNTHKGTARDLDSTLFLYGPLGPDEAPTGAPIAEDDDSGWGRHARIKDFEIPTQGDYVAVLGTYAGLDRGQYRLTLTCLEGECAPAAAPILVDAEDLLITEGGETDSFTVRLGAAPTDHVVIWVETSDADEAAPYPSKLVFCAPGYVPDPNGCVEAEDPAQVEAEPDWARVVEVEVHGVRDAEPGDDTEFALSFTVETDAPAYADARLLPVTGVCFDDGAELDWLDDVDGLEDAALIEALYAKTRGHVSYGYLGQNSIRTVMFSTVDLYDGVVESFYDGRTVALPRDATNAYRSDFNTEHTWPQGQFDKLEPMKSDLHHIFPTDTASNASRANYDFGMLEEDPGDASALGESELSLDKVFQVRPSRRGDVARAHFYMAARYALATDEIGIAFDDDADPDNGCINDAEEAVLRRWHAEDPVDDLERTRNNRVEAYQGNRNPFVDRPELVDRIRDF